MENKQNTFVLLLTLLLAQAQGVSLEQTVTTRSDPTFCVNNQLATGLQQSINESALAKARASIPFTLADPGFVTTGAVNEGMTEVGKKNFLDHVNTSLCGSGKAALDQTCCTTKIIPAMEVKTVTETHVEHEVEEAKKFLADSTENLKYTLKGCLKKDKHDYGCTHGQEDVYIDDCGH